MIRSAVAPQPAHDNITNAASRMQRAARETGPSADTQAQVAAQVSPTSKNGRSEVVTQLNAG